MILAPAGDILAQHLMCIGELPEVDRQAFSALDAEVRQVKRGRDIIRAGHRPNNAVVVLSGFLYRYTLGPEGARQIHSFYMPTEAPCLETLHIDYMDHNLAAVVESEIALIPHDQLYRIIEERPEGRKLLWRQTLVQTAIMREWLMRNSKLPADASLAHLFCEMFTRAKAAGLVSANTFDLPLTQELAADALGLTSVHTNRTLQRLRRSGAVEWRNGTLTVKDWNKLSDLAAFDARYLHLRCG